MEKMIEKMNFRLEYNEKQGCFHFDNYNHVPNTCGWVTICDSLPDKQCTQFFKKIYNKYAILDYPGKDKLPKPNIETLRNEFAEFMKLTELKSILSLN